jgi:hypothetical protein
VKLSAFAERWRSYRESVMSSLSSLQRFEILKKKVLRHERIEGIYILEAARVPTSWPNGYSLDSFLRDFAFPFGFREPDVGEAEWNNAEVFRDDARSQIVEALVGGAEIGHSRWDVPPPDADALASEFLALFGEEARFFCKELPQGEAQILAPYGRPDFYDFIFDGGCVAIDERLAAVFWILDSD